MKARPSESGAQRAGHETLRKARKLLRLVRDPRYRRGMRHRVAAAIEHEDVPFEHDFACVIDVGAHAGQFALFATQRFPGARLFCLEPLPGPRKRLEAVLRDGPGATILPVAAGLRSELREMHVSAADDSSSLLPITDRATSAFPGTHEVDRLEVRTERLDRALADERIERPALLKIDVQGAELEVLRGATGLLDSIDEILVEVSFVELYDGQPLAAEIVSFLHECGFALKGVFGVTLDRSGRNLQADFLFAPR